MSKSKFLSYRQKYMRDVQYHINHLENPNKGIEAFVYGNKSSLLHLYKKMKSTIRIIATNKRPSPETEQLCMPFSKLKKRKGIVAFSICGSISGLRCFLQNIQKEYPNLHIAWFYSDSNSHEIICHDPHRKFFSEFDDDVNEFC